MAIANRVASNMAEALRLTPHQIITMSRALVRMGQTSQPQARRGTPEEFEAIIFGLG